MKPIFTLILGVMLAVSARAADKTPLVSQDNIADKYFDKTDPVLTPQERAALAIAQQWETYSAAGKPVTGKDGAVQYVYGMQYPSIVCAVLQVCDVALQAGEQVNSTNLGDTVRWTVEPAITGIGATEVEHLIVKPLDVGLDTSLIVTTNRRTYHLRLRSHRTEYMPSVSFIYPDEAQAKWAVIERRETEHREANTMPETGEYLGNLNFDYDVSGTARWKPVRVYNDGRKTVIEMPQAMQQTEAPSLLVVRKEGGLFHGEDTVMVNYRVQGDRYIVDAIFDHAILIAGVGRNQDRVTIIRKGK